MRETWRLELPCTRITEPRPRHLLEALDLDLDRCINGGEEYFESATANPAMQRVNEKLGYRLNGLAELRFVKPVG